jgi:hypothetical protein
VNVTSKRACSEVAEGAVVAVFVAVIGFDGPSFMCSQSSARSAASRSASSSSPQAAAMNARRVAISVVRNMGFSCSVEVETSRLHGQGRREVRGDLLRGDGAGHRPVDSVEQCSRK